MTNVEKFVVCQLNVKIHPTYKSVIYVPACCSHIMLPLVTSQAAVIHDADQLVVFGSMYAHLF